MNSWAVKTRFTVLLISMFMALSLYSKGEAMVLPGKLIYGEADSIYALDLSTLKFHTVYKEKEGFHMFVHLTKVDNKRLLFEDNPHRLIKELDLETGSVRTFRSGSGPQYIATHRKLFFYGTIPGKAQVGLFVADLENAKQSPQVVHEGPFSTTDQVIQVSKDDVVFNLGEKLWKYNILTGALGELSIEGCTLPQVFRSASGQLLCFDTSTQRYFLTDLNGERIEHVTALKDNAAVLYVPDYDILIFVKVRFQLFPPLGEVYDIWGFSFKDEKTTRLQKNFVIGLGSAIWVN